MVPSQKQATVCKLCIPLTADGKWRYRVAESSLLMAAGSPHLHDEGIEVIRESSDVAGSLLPQLLHISFTVVTSNSELIAN